VLAVKFSIYQPADFLAGLY